MILLVYHYLQRFDFVIIQMYVKKMLERKELTERLADKITKAGLPRDSSLREDNNVCEHPVDPNASLLTDFDDAIKSAVEDTTTDPIFEGFLKEIFNCGDNDTTSPDEDSDARQNQGPSDQANSR